MKGYKTSKDYEKLYTLVKDGYRILGWAEELFYEHKIKKVVEIKIANKESTFLSIGAPGYSYGLEDTKEGFIHSCNFFNLEYIEPNE